MVQHAGRISCPRCGANNFDTVSVCWKCQLPLSAAAAPPPGMTMSPAMPMPQPTALAPERSMHAAPAYAPAQATGDSGVARRAAIAFALTIPWISLPVGWTFMMIEDHRRQAIGRICVAWSLIALFIHLLLMFVAAQSIGPYLTSVITMMGKAAAQPQGGRDLGGGSGGM